MQVTRAVFGPVAAAALLAVGIAIVRRMEHPDGPGQTGPCKCLNWREAYRMPGVVCGMAAEFYVATGKGTPGPKARKLLGDEFCGKFFERINDDFCVNMDFTHAPGSFRGSQWCLVSSECTALFGGKRLPGTDLSWRFCAEGDHRLRDKTPEELDRIRETKDLDLGLLTKFAYPIWQGAKWPDVGQYILGAGAATLRENDGRDDLTALLRSGDPMLFDSRDTHPPFHVVSGGKVYQIDFKPGGRRAYAKGQMSEVNWIRCIEGCNT